MNPLYELVPISEKPPADGFYNLVDFDGHPIGDWLFKKNEWASPEEISNTWRWLREIPAETLKARIREELGKAFTAGQQHQYQKEHGGFYQPDCETHINSIIDKLFKQKQ